MYISKNRGYDHYSLEIVYGMKKFSCVDFATRIQSFEKDAFTPFCYFIKTGL